MEQAVVRHDGRHDLDARERGKKSYRAETHLLAPWGVHHATRRDQADFERYAGHGTAP